MAVERAIIPERERIVSFYGDNIPVAQTEDEELYVPLRPISGFLGLDYSGQRQRILRNEVMAARMRPIQMSGADGKQREQLCLPLDLLPGWLFGVDTARVKEHLREKLRRYQAEAFKVLWDAFKGNILPTSQVSADQTPAEKILEQVEAMALLARQQVEFERGLADVVGRQQVMADYVRGFIQQTNARLSSLEMRLDPAAQITDAQAAEIALGVKNVAYAMEERGAGGGYGKVYSEMYRRYRISSYKNLAQAKYDEVIAWLSRWYDEITKEGKPTES